jgi:Uncharacterized conserved protein (COG2071)
MNGLFADRYKSPSRYRLLNRLEDKFLSADDTWWSGRDPFHTRVVAEVPRALYLNYLAEKSYVAALAPGLFRPLDLPCDKDKTLFTILLFTLERARPLWAPPVFGALTRRMIQSNWRFYGHITEPGSESRQSVLFIRTITTSLLLSAFGRRLARCFPLRRAHRMMLGWTGSQLTAVIDPGGGSSPELIFEGEQAESSQLSAAFRQQFLSYEAYARWIIDQHLSLVIWPREYVLQDMHLDFQRARIVPLQSLKCRISGLKDFVPDHGKPLDCFMVEGLRVFLDNIYTVTKQAER